MKQFIRFGIVGSIGFIVDASILMFFVNYMDFTIPISRVFSFLCAVFATWFINRNFTFSNNIIYNKKKEYGIYLLVQTIGAFINYFFFIILVYKYEIMENFLVFPLAIAAIITMFFNFFMIKKFAYYKN